MTTASYDAYQAIVDDLPKRRAAVFTVIVGHSLIWGLTIREACDILRWPHTTVSARIFELAEAGLIKSKGEQRMGQTVWIKSLPEEVEEIKGQRAAARKARKSPRVRRLERALREALNLLEADGDRHNVWRAALEDKPWPPTESEAEARIAGEVAQQKLL